MIREKRRKKARMKRLFIALAGLILFLAIAAVVVLKVFVVKTVNVVGNQLYDETLIKETVLNDKYSSNSLYVFLKYTFVDTEPVPFIDTIEVTLDNPQAITIQVYEKGMMGYINMDASGQMAYFDKDGFVVETSTRLIENVPRIEGISCSEIVLYEKLPIEEAKLKQILTLTQDLKRAAIEPDAIRYGVENAPVLFYGDITVQMGSMEYLTQKIERLSEMLPKLSGMTGILHLENWSEQTVNVVFEKPVEEETETETETETESETETETETETEIEE